MHKKNKQKQFYAEKAIEDHDNRCNIESIKIACRNNNRKKPEKVHRNYRSTVKDKFPDLLIPPQARTVMTKTTSNRRITNKSSNERVIQAAMPPATDAVNRIAANIALLPPVHYPRKWAHSNLSKTIVA